MSGQNVRVRGVSGMAATWLRIALMATLLASPSLDAQQVLIDFGEDWSFLRGTGEPSTPPTAWRNPGFDDSSWESGPMGFGYGDDDDATVLDDMQQDDAADPPVPGYLTVYCRKTINVTNPGALQSLLLTIDYDDSFICYVNGAEVARANIGAPLEEVSFDTDADGNHEAGTPEFFDITSSLGELVAGTNIIAIEGHNTSLTSSDFSLNARLSANDPRAECPSDLVCTTEAEGVTLTWTSFVDYDAIAVLRDGVPIPGSPFAGTRTSVVDTEPGDYSNQYTVIATIGGVQCPALTCATTPTLVLIEAGDDWRFFRGTQAPSTPAEAWRAPGFDDATWEVGPTGIGYGDGNDATVLDDMEQIADDPDTPEDESQPGYLSLFARKTFEVGALPTITNLFLEMDYDDGFIAYLNGEEVARSPNMGQPGEEYAFDDPADAGRDVTELFDLTALVDRFVQGTNVLAVQVHNVSLTSSDLDCLPRLVVNGCASVSNLTCSYDDVSGEVTLSWDFGTAVDAVEVTRNGEPIDGSPFAPDATSAVDSSAGSFDNEYEVIPIIGSYACAGATCTVECGDRGAGVLSCDVSLVGGVTQALLQWPARAGASSVEVRREGALIATLDGAETEYLDLDVESDEPEADTDYEITFVFPSGDECTYSCGPICLLPDLVCSVVDTGGILRPELTWGENLKEWDSFSILRDGVEIAAGLPGDTTTYLDEEVELLFGISYDYDIVPIAPVGEEPGGSCDTNTLTCTVSGPVDETGSYDEPAGGWDYFVDFSALGALQYNPNAGEAGNLDGEWIRAVDDQWDGSAPEETGPAPGGPAPGGLELRIVDGGGACGETVEALRLLNPGNTTDPSAGSTVDRQFPDPFDEPNNSSLLLGIDTGVTDRNLLRDGVTFAARWRAQPEPPDYMNPQPAGDGTPFDGGIGQIGFYFVDEPGDSGLGDGAGLAFTLQSSADFGQMMMSTAPAINLPAAHINMFRTIWVTVEDPEGDDTYDVTVYINGDEAPFAAYTVTDEDLQAGDPDFGAPVGNYLAIAVPGQNQDGDIEIEHVGYKLGLHPPSATECVPSDNNRPTARITAAPSTTVTLVGGSASVTLDGLTSDDGDGGAQGLSYQWSKLAGPSGDTIETPSASQTLITFNQAGSYRYQLRVDDGEPANNTATASVDITVRPAGGDPLFVRGDANSDGNINLTDGIVILNFLFLGQAAPACVDASDVDDSGGARPSITDAIRVFNWLFSGGLPPVEPEPSRASYLPGDCGPDATADEMDCLTPAQKCQ